MADETSFKYLFNYENILVGFEIYLDVELSGILVIFILIYEFKVF